MKPSVAVLVALAACARPPASAPAPATSPETPVNDRMLLHFDLATRARDAVVEGDLATARLASGQVEHLDTALFPDPWRPYVADLRAAAADAAQAPTLDRAAAGVGRIALACATCHQALGGGPKGDAAAVLAEGPSGGASMRRHEVAMDGMWVGLVAPSEAAWVAGATWIEADDLELPADASEPRVGLRARVRGLAGEARTETSMTHRAALFGELLATCAECHDAVARP